MPPSGSPPRSPTSDGRRPRQTDRSCRSASAGVTFVKLATSAIASPASGPAIACLHDLHRLVDEVAGGHERLAVEALLARELHRTEHALDDLAVLVVVVVHVERAALARRVQDGHLDLAHRRPPGRCRPARRAAGTAPPCGGEPTLRVVTHDHPGRRARRPRRHPRHGPGAGRVRAHGRPGRARPGRVRPPPVRPGPGGVGDHRRGRRGGRRHGPVVPDVLDVPRPAGHLARGPVRAPGRSAATASAAPCCATCAR